MARFLSYTFYSRVESSAFFLVTHSFRRSPVSLPNSLTGTFLSGTTAACCRLSRVLARVPDVSSLAARSLQEASATLHMKYLTFVKRPRTSSNSFIRTSFPERQNTRLSVVSGQARKTLWTCGPGLLLPPSVKVSTGTQNFAKESLSF